MGVGGGGGGGGGEGRRGAAAALKNKINFPSPPFDQDVSAAMCPLPLCRLSQHPFRTQDTRRLDRKGGSAARPPGIKRYAASRNQVPAQL